MYFLSEAARRELQEVSENLNINAVIEEALSEEVNMYTALHAVQTLEQASLPGPSTSNSLKRPAVDQKDNGADSDDDDLINPCGRLAAVLPKTRGKNLSLVRKSVRRRAALPTDSVCSSFSSSTTPRSSNEGWMEKIEQELQRREEFNRDMEGKMSSITEKIRGLGDHISRIQGEKKSVRAHREALGEQIRLLDPQELFLDKRERAATERKK
ncbi:hypothetical protein NQ315_012253 [Exocentrus adspersus]|uniref:Uncharacterized protein n=1 Tax=Exocentrus adspersus TaxID=1586481 RepID=A0AAV8VER2_9CUCU|nr:hypothetical protein NQ315_012253 [Exocentrus adspersus]